MLPTKAAFQNCISRAQAVQANTIGFVQICRVTNTKTKTNALPSDQQPAILGRVTDKGWAVDALRRHIDGWLLHDRNGFHDTNGSPYGDSTSTPVVPAKMEDTPSWDRGDLMWEFQTFEIAMKYTKFAPPDDKSGGWGGQVLGGLRWGFTVRRIGRDE